MKKSFLCVLLLGTFISDAVADPHTLLTELFTDSSESLVVYATKNPPTLISEDVPPPPLPSNESLLETQASWSRAQRVNQQISGSFKKSMEEGRVAVSEPSAPVVLMRSKSPQCSLRPGGIYQEVDTSAPLRLILETTMQLATGADSLLQQTSIRTDSQQYVEECTTRTSTEGTDLLGNRTILYVVETEETSVDFLLETTSVTGEGKRTSWSELTISPLQMRRTESTSTVTSQHEDETPKIRQEAPAPTTPEMCKRSLSSLAFDGPYFSREDGVQWGKKPKKSPSGKKKVFKEVTQQAKAFALKVVSSIIPCLSLS